MNHWFQDHQDLLSRTWWLVMTTDTTTTASYWINWRFLLCATWITVSMVFASLLIWRYEGRRISRNRSSGDREAAGCLYEHEVWGTCSKLVHPVWLIAYRTIAFTALLALLIADISINGRVKFFFYTEWTFTLVTVYFGLGSSLSIHGFFRYRHERELLERDCCVLTDANNGSYVPPSLEENAEMPSQNEGLNLDGGPNCKTAASVWGYALQIIFQICAGAVVLTDFVFWLVIYPYITVKDYRLSFLIVCKHTVNAVFLLGDAILNRLRFPFFRMAYFVLWTSIYVVFQWIIHACISIRWPYPFLDLSSSYAPLWYLLIGLLHFPCFGTFMLIYWIKQRYSSR